MMDDMKNILKLYDMIFIFTKDCATYTNCIKDEKGSVETYFRY